MALIEKNPEPNKHIKFSGNDNNFYTPSQSELGLSDAFADRYNSALSTYDPNSVEDTFIDRLANFFGFRSSADKMRLEINQARQEQLNQLVNQQAEQEYNTEAAKAQRERQAGLNPDLIGLGDASEATEGSEPEQRLDFSQLVSGDDFIKSFSGAFSSAIAACSSIQGLLSTGIDIRDKIFNHNNLLQAKSWNILRNTNSLDDLKRMFFEDEAYPFYNDDILKDYGLRSKRDRKFFRQFVSTRKAAFEGQLEKYKTFDDYLKAQDSLFGEMSKWYRSKDNAFDVGPSLKIFNDYEHSVYEAGLKAQESKSNYEKGFYDKLNPEQAASAVNNSNEYQSDYFSTKSGFTQGSSENAVARFNKKKTELQKQLYDRLSGRADKGDIFAMMLLTHLLAGTNPVGDALDVVKGVAKFL